MTIDKNKLNKNENPTLKTTPVFGVSELLKFDTGMKLKHGARIIYISKLISEFANINHWMRPVMEMDTNKIIIMENEIYKVTGLLIVTAIMIRGDKLPFW